LLHRPAGTRGVGLCKAGERTCQAGVFGGCEGQVLPAAESCNGADDNCDGTVDEGCSGAPCGNGIIDTGEVCDDNNTNVCVRATLRVRRSSLS